MADTPPSLTPGEFTSLPEQDYILGTHDSEVTRLGVQHDAWRSYAIECWNRAGIRPGDRVLDVGAGPGFAALDLAKLVGPDGRVTAVERSERFIDAGRAMAGARGISNVDFVRHDLMRDGRLEGTFDAAWCRWVASFVESPDELVAAIAGVLRPGGVVAFHEYAHYSTWSYSPRRPLVDAYVSHVMDSWRAVGGEPDVAAALPPALAAHGFEIEYAMPRVFCVRPGSPLWRWIAMFADSNLERLVSLNACDRGWAESVRAELRSAEDDPNTLMLTPLVMEIVARRSDSQAAQLKGDA